MRTALKVLGWLLLTLVVVGVVFIAAFHAPDRSVSDLKVRWAPPPSEFRAIAGMQVHLRDEGLPTDPVPIVLLHGTSASLHTWDGWVDALKAERRVIRYDMPAFGLTGPSPDGDYTIESYARMVIAVLDEREIDRCILVGNSLGGYVAWATALLHPDHVERIVLIDSAGYPFESQSVPLAFKIAQTPVLNKLMESVLPRSLVRSSLENVYGDPSLVTPELVDQYFELNTRAGNRQALAERFRQTQPGALADRVGEISQPTLILWGGRDRLIPPELGDRFDAEIADSTLVRFEELGHVPHEEDPTATVAAFKEFLARER